MPLNVKRGDTHDVYLIVQDKATGLPVDLTGASPKLFVKTKTGPAITLVATVDGDPTLGRVKHTLTGDLDVGTYALEVQLTVGSVITTAPTIGAQTLVVAQDIAD